jgi:hypothetical protein
MSSLRITKSRKQTNDSIDLSLRHSLKNWVARKDPPTDGRDRLLAAVQANISTPQPKPSRFNFEWFFRSQGDQEVLNYRLIYYRYTLESDFSLRANMALL